MAGQANLGFLYETGRGGLPRDDAEAARLYRLAAEQGVPFAQNKLAMFYEEGPAGYQKISAKPPVFISLRPNKTAIWWQSGEHGTP